MTENQIIAEFMGLEWNSYERLKRNYESNWNELMPVVEKIESIHDDHHGYFGVHIHSNACDIQGTMLFKAIEENSDYGWVYMSDPNAIFPTKLESTYYAVVEFIKWYNINYNELSCSKI